MESSDPYPLPNDSDLFAPNVDSEALDACYRSFQTGRTLKVTRKIDVHAEI